MLLLMLGISGIVSIVFFILGGFIYVKSDGDLKGNAVKAEKHIKIGLFFLLVALIFAVLILEIDTNRFILL